MKLMYDTADKFHLNIYKKRKENSPIIWEAFSVNEIYMFKSIGHEVTRVNTPSS